MKTNFPRWILTLVALIVALGAPALFGASEAEAAAGRAILKKNADAIVGVELVLAQKGGRGGRGPSERKVEVSGTVISKSGLTVASLFSIDGGAAAVASTRGGESPDMEFKEVKLRLADNSEVEASVVLKDAELDAAFIVPVGAGATKEYAFVDLTQSVEPGILNTYFEVGRLGKTLQRVAVVNNITVIGVLERPRKVALLEDNATPGIPVFDVNGKLLGLGLLFGTSRFVVVPPSDIADMAKQATAARESSLPMPLPAAK